MHKQNKGFTALELMITLAVLGVILAIAAPSVSGYKDKRRVIEVAEAIYSQLQFARSEGLARSQNLSAIFTANNTTTWKMGLSTNASCVLSKLPNNADVSDACHLFVSDGDATLDPGDGTTDRDDLVYYTLNSADFSNVIVSTTAGAVTFDSVRGTANGATIRVKFGTQYQINVVVAPVGRIRLCSPAGAMHVGGYSSVSC